MKSRIVVLMIVLLVLLESVVFAQEGVIEEINLSLKQKQSQQQKQKQEATAMAEQATIFKGERVVPGILPNLPLQQIIPPSEKEASFWNDWAIDPNHLERVHTRKEVSYALKNTGVWFSECLTGPLSFLCPIKAIYVPSGIPKTNQVKLLLEIPTGKFTVMRSIIVRADERYSKRMLLDAALKLAMDNGATAALLVGDGLNADHLGESIGLPFGIVSADKNSSFSGGVGIAQSSLKKVGEPWLAVIPIK